MQAITPFSQSDVYMWAELPTEDTIEVLDNLGPSALKSCSLVCKRWYQFLNSEDVWQPLLQSHFPSITPGAIKSFPACLHLYANLSKGVCSITTLSEVHTGAIGSIAVQGDNFFSSSADKKIKIWDRHTHTCLATLEEHKARVNSIVPHGNLLFSSSDDGEIKMWDLIQRTCVGSLEGPVGSVSAIAPAQDNMLIFGSSKGAIQICDRTTTPFSYKATLTGHQNKVTSLVIQGNVLFSSSADQTIKRWDLTTHECTGTIKGHTGPVLCIAVQGNLLFSGSLDKTVKIWDLSSMPIKCAAVLQGHGRAVTSIALQNGLLFSSSADKTIKIWDLTTHNCTATLKGHFDLVLSVVPQGEKLFSSSNGGTINIWDFATSHTQILSEIAGALEGPYLEEAGLAIERFSTLPKQLQSGVFVELCEIFHRAIGGKDAFYTAQAATDAQRAQAIRTFLGKLPPKPSTAIVSYNKTAS
jgi:WD40 repeat protein